ASGHAPQAAGATSPMPPMDHSGNLDGMQNRGFMARFTTATGYVATGLLAFTLLIGPANLLLRRQNPVSSYLRRDVGMWTAIVSVVHVIAGLQVHGPPGPLDTRILRYFFAPDGSPLLDAFGLGNWTGLAATVIVVGLLAISSDVALRKLKAGPWKWLQRLNYALFALVVAHAMYYAAFGGALLRITSPSTLLLGPSVVAVFVGQTVGVWLWRRRYVRTTGRRYARATAQPA
ncbi:MAG: ferric reductase-like transmembrane domain-containing protein, partial [Chloroflexota bacterium]